MLNCEMSPSSSDRLSAAKPNDYVLKILLVGDSDVGTEEILNGLAEGTIDSPYTGCTGGVSYKTVCCQKLTIMYSNFYWLETAM